MSITVYYVLVTLLLAGLIGLLMGGGFYYGGRLSELDEPGSESDDS